MRRVAFLISSMVIVLLLSTTTAFAQTEKRRAKDKGYIIVTRYVKANGKRDVSDDIQRVIDRNPNRTIYFPDGEYIISKPISTPAEPTRSVALELSNYAVIRASEDWSSQEAMVRLGGKDKANNIRVAGSNYYLRGGVIDGNGVARAISIDSGRETAVRECSIKRATVGLHIKYGANSGSSDCDIRDVNITGCNPDTSIGVIIEGYDNTLTNMRIGGVHTGVVIRSSGNNLRNIHPLYYGRGELYATSCGFKEERGNNWYDYCYSDEFATAFITSDGPSLYLNCYAYWYSNRGEKHTVMRATGRFRDRVVNMNVGFTKRNCVKRNVILEVEKSGGKGYFDNLHINDSRFANDDHYKKYLKP